jgi:uncharacterized protein (DUF849 family)
MGQVLNAIRDKNKDVIICLTTGAGVGHTPEMRIAPVPKFKPELASCNCGTINWGLFAMKSTIKEFKTDWEEQWLENTRGFTFQNDFASMEKMLSLMQESGTKPELEVYDIGHLYNIAFMIKTGVLKTPISIQYITGILGGIGSTPYDLMNLHQTADRLIGKGNYIWSIVGAGKMEFPMATMAMLMGGHCRIGLEDNLYLSKGVLAKNNAELVGKAAHIMKQFDYEPATPAEAREILSLPQK